MKKMIQIQNVGLSLLARLEAYSPQIIKLCVMGLSSKAKDGTYGNILLLNDLAKTHVVAEDSEPEVLDSGNDFAALLVQRSKHLVALGSYFERRQLGISVFYVQERSSLCMRDHQFKF